MRKRIAFKNPISWEKCASLSFLAGSIFIAYGGDDKVYAIKIDEKEFDRITASLKRKKIAFSEES